MDAIVLARWKAAIMQTTHTFTLLYLHEPRLNLNPIAAKFIFVWPSYGNIYIFHTMVDVN